MSPTPVYNQNKPTQAPKRRRKEKKSKHKLLPNKLLTQRPQFLCGFKPRSVRGWGVELAILEVYALSI